MTIMGKIRTPATIVTPFRRAVKEVANRWAEAKFADQELENEICKATRCSYSLAVFIARKIRNLTF